MAAAAAAAAVAAPGIWSSCAFAIGVAFVWGGLLTLNLGNQKGLKSPNWRWVLLLVRSCAFSRAGAAGAAGGGLVVVLAVVLATGQGPPPNRRAAAAPPGWHAVRVAMAGGCKHRCMVGCVRVTWVDGTRG